MRRPEAPVLALTLLLAAGIAGAAQTGPFVTSYTVQWRGM